MRKKREREGEGRKGKRLYCLQRGFKGTRVIDCTGSQFSPVYEKINPKKKILKFMNKINIFTINEAQNKNFFRDS